jgi:hypothetical protein
LYDRKQRLVSCRGTSKNGGDYGLRSSANCLWSLTRLTDVSRTLQPSTVHVDNFVGNRDAVRREGRKIKARDRLLKE